MSSPRFCWRRCSSTSRSCFPIAPAPGFAARASACLRCCTCPPACCLRRTSSPSAGCRTNTQLYSRILTLLDQIEPLYLSVFMIAGLVVLTRAMDRVRSATARRQLRWIIWGTAFGAGPVRDRIRAAVCAGPARVAADGALGHPAQPRAARVRLGAHPLSPDGRRGHRQAQPRLHRRHPRHLHDLRDAAAARAASCFSTRPSATT